MADALFDTTVFIDYYRGDKRAAAPFEAVFDGSLGASYSAITGFEIWIGVTDHEEEIDYSSLLGSLEEAPLSASMARLAASWIRSISGRSSEALVRDAFIAATAAERGEAIYTRNVRDFARFQADVKTY